MSIMAIFTIKANLFKFKNMGVCAKSGKNTDQPRTQYMNTSLAAQGALAHRLQRRTACNTSPPA